MSSTWSSCWESKANLKNHAGHPQLHGFIRSSFQGGDYKLVRSILSATHCDDRINSNKPTMLYGYRRQQPKIPLSLNELSSPMNPSNVITLVTPAPRTEPQIYPNQGGNNPFQSEMFETSDISSPWKGCQHGECLANIFRRWDIQIRQTTKFISYFEAFVNPTTPRRHKSKLNLRMSLPK